MMGALFRRKQPRSAAEWFAARRNQTDPALDLRFQKWLAEDETHGEEYALCELTWEVSGRAARQMPTPTWSRWRGTALRGGAATLAVAACLGALLIWLRQSPVQTWSTAAGEQRTVILEDGSCVTLNTRTRIQVRFERHERDVVLTAGEAFFEVAKDPKRPFVVRTKLGSALAVGTRFDVYLRESALIVTTEEGRVLVDGSLESNGVLVTAGEQAVLNRGGVRAVVRSADLREALDWRNGRLDVKDVPLGLVLKDFSRYTAVPIYADTPAIASVRISAVLRAGDVTALAAALKGAFGLQIERRSAALVVVSGKSGATASSSPDR